MFIIEGVDCKCYREVLLHDHDSCDIFYKSRSSSYGCRKASDKDERGASVSCNGKPSQNECGGDEVDAEEEVLLQPDSEAADRHHKGEHRKPRIRFDGRVGHSQVAKGESVNTLRNGQHEQDTEMESLRSRALVSCKFVGFAHLRVSHTVADVADSENDYPWSFVTPFTLHFCTSP